MILTQHGMNSIQRSQPVPPGPVELPDRTIRLQMTSSSVDPTSWTPVDTSKSYQWTIVSGTDDTWDCTYDYTDWTSVFSGKTEIARVLGANLAEVTTMKNAFSGCSSLLTVDGITDSEQLVSTHNMFYNCTSLVSVSPFDTSNVTNIIGMFRTCKNLEEIPYINTSSVTQMTSACSECQKITTIPQFDLHNVTTMDQAFAFCDNLVNVPDLNTSKAIIMTGLFQNCKSLETAPNMSFANAMDVSSLFYDCYALKNVPNYDMTYARVFKQTFYACRSLTQIPDIMITTTSGGTGRVITNVQSMFAYCRNVESGILDFYNTVKNVSGLTYSKCFTYCGVDTTSGSAELSQIPSGWK